MPLLSPSRELGRFVLPKALSREKSGPGAFAGFGFEAQECARSLQTLKVGTVFENPARTDRRGDASNELYGEQR
jgi:hypothetical protein